MGILTTAGIKNPAMDFLDKHRQALIGLGTGIANGRGISQGLGLGAQGLAQGSQADTAYAAAEQAKADQQAKISETITYLRSNPAFADIADAVEKGGISPGDGFTEAWKRQAAAAEKASAGPKMPYAGTGMDAQNWNILLTGDPASKDYAAAYAQVTEPKITYTQGPEGLVPVMQQPHIPPGIKPPTYAGDTPAAPITAPGPRLGSPDAGLAPSIAPQGTPAPIGDGMGLSVGAPLPGTTSKPTEAQQRLGLLSTSLNTAAPEVMKGFDALSDTKQQIIGLGGGLTRPWQSEDYQKATTALKSAISDIIPAISGAAFSASEIKEKIDTFTPKIGDKPGNIALKKQLFLAYVQGIANASNDPAAKAIAQQFLDALNAEPKAGVVDMGDGITIEPFNG